MYIKKLIRLFFLAQIAFMNISYAKKTDNLSPKAEFYLDMIKKLEKAPRPDLSHEIVGQLLCDITGIKKQINNLTSEVNQCCNSNETSFDSTFTVIENTKKTIEECCINIANEFSSTFSIIDNFFDELYPDLKNEFNGTFTALRPINSSIINLINQIQLCCNTLEGRINNCCSFLIDYSQTISGAAASYIPALLFTQALSNATNCIVSQFGSC